MNFYNERLAPRMLCQLLYDVVPYEFHRPVIFSYGHKHMLKEHERNQGVTNHRCVWLNLEAIAFDGGNGYRCSVQAGVWRRMLFVGFHEFAHITSPTGNGYRYEHDWKYHRHIEDQANAKAEDWIAKVLANDGRLYQPDFLGIVDIVRCRNQKSLKKLPSHGSYYCNRLKDLRCYRCGGQLSISDVAHRLLRHASFDPPPQELEKIRKKINAIRKKYQEEKVRYLKFSDYEKMNQEDKEKLKELENKESELGIQSYRKEHRKKFRLIHKYGDDLARIYIDHAGRQHHFWVWGDLPIIAQRLKKGEK